MTESVEDARLAVPYAISLRGLLEVISAWNRARAYDESLSAQEVAERVSYKTKTVTRQSPFLCQIGILERRGQKYRLSSSGRRVAKLADHSQEEEFKDTMRRLLLDCRELKSVIEFISKDSPVTREQLVTRIIMHSDRPSADHNAKTGATALVDLLEEVGLIRLDEKGFHAVSFPRQEVPKIIELVEVEDTTVPEFTTSMAVKRQDEASSAELEIRIQVSITAGQTSDTSFIHGLIVRIRDLLHTFGLKEVE
ncbi:MAG: hypothetical protein ACXADO_00415 [Candidatus Thorarchaeota archaeon]|jgi:hypothetical protein